MHRPITRGPATLHALRPGLRAAVLAFAAGIVLVVAYAVSENVSAHLERAALDEAARSTETVVRTYIDPLLPAGTLRADPSDAAAQIDGELERMVASGHLLRIKIWAPDRTVVYSDLPELRGRRFQLSDDTARAFQGETETGISDGEAEENLFERPLATRFLEIYLPIRSADGTVVGVYEIYEDAAPIEARIAAARRDVFAIAGLGALALFVLIFVAFAGASRLLARQNRLLRERADRDPLTGLANHGHLLRRVDEELRRDDPAGALALIDIDNFRLLNLGYGYAAGDTALRAVAERLAAVARPGQLFGRFGPDEFLLVDFEAGIERLLATLADLRGALGELALRFDGSEALPLTVATGVARPPGDGHRAIELVGVAETALLAAKTGGGDAIQVADESTMESLARQNTAFGVLEGLVNTVDAKDRYTRRHSEDVTTQALLLADAVGLDTDHRRIVRLAGLLHDVGKVGIPDAILRKPGALTPQEYEIVKQHVALGDAIVGAVPQLSEVRAGVRHHHERWDGTGYLDRLAGTRIPLVARVLAVADAFSAMTTTRPYRKALSEDEALARVDEAAGTQLDPELASAFVRAKARAPQADPAQAGARTLPEPATATT